jgi:hypothetical protein
LVGVVLVFFFGWKWVAWVGIAFLILKWSFFLWVRYRFGSAESSLQQIRMELAELSGFDAEELIRRLRQVEVQWPYLPSIVYSLLRLGSGRAITHKSTGKV